MAAYAGLAGATTGDNAAAVWRQGCDVKEHPAALVLGQADTGKEHRHPGARLLGGDDKRIGRVALDVAGVVCGRRLVENEMRTDKTGLVVVVHREGAGVQVGEVVDVNVVLNDDLPIGGDGAHCGRRGLPATGRRGPLQ